jgi:hypothetical protein
MNRDMSEQQTDDILNSVVSYFLSVKNFDHPQETSISDAANMFGISVIDAGKAFFIAREKASLAESEQLDGGDGTETKKVKHYGDESLDEMLFGKKTRNE